MLVTANKQKVVRTNPVSLKEFYQKRNRVLLIRSSRGLGDILMHRQIFEDFKRVMPDMHLTFACPRIYFEAVQDHPFVDEVVDSTKVNRDNFLVSYNTSNCCVRWECGHAPHANKHRADIWAEHCGFSLTKHDMHVPFIDHETMQFGLFQVRQARGMAPKIFGRNSPNFLFCPISFDKLRTLTNEQIIGVVQYLREKNYFVYSTHDTRVPLLEELGVPVFSGYAIPQWFSFIHAADYVISADTATFHYAGGIKKPLVGVFTHADGKYRGQYYDFVLVQKHRDDGNWPCGPCYNAAMCSHPKGGGGGPKPCLTELKVQDIIDGIEKVLKKWKYN